MTSSILSNNENEIEKLAVLGSLQKSFLLDKDEFSEQNIKQENRFAKNKNNNKSILVDNRKG